MILIVLAFSLPVITVLEIYFLEFYKPPKTIPTWAITRTTVFPPFVELGINSKAPNTSMGYILVNY